MISAPRTPIGGEPAERTALATVLNPYVHVVNRIGESFFPRCTMDLFERDRLTITSLDDPSAPPRVFEPGTWREATAFDARHDLLYSFIAGMPCAALVPILDGNTPKGARR